MSFFNKIRKNFKWLGNKVKRVSKFIGNKVAPVGKLIGTGVSFLAPEVGASIYAGSKLLESGSKMVSGVIDGIGGKAQKMKSDGIQKIKSKIKQKLNYR